MAAPILPHVNNLIVALYFITYFVIKFMPFHGPLFFASMAPLLVIIFKTIYKYFKTTFFTYFICCGCFYIVGRNIFDSCKQQK